MTAAALISLRETAEASIVVCIILALLTRINRNDFKPAVWSGVLCGIAVSILCSLVLSRFSQHLPIDSRSLYEGGILVAASLLVLWTMLWMSNAGKGMKNHIEKKAEAHVLDNKWFGVFLLSFTATLREGMEMAFLIHATLLGNAQPLHTLAGIGLGATGAILLAVLVMQGIRFVPLRLFFTTSTLLLLILGTHLMMEGIEALQHFSSHLASLTLLVPVIGILYILTAGLLWRRKNA